MSRRFLLACILAVCTNPVAADVRIGDVIPELTFTDTRFLPRTLADFGPQKAYVLVFTTTTCPLAQRYMPRLNELATRPPDQGVQFLGVNVGEDESIQDVAYFTIEYKAAFPFVKDFDGSTVRALGVTRTPEVVILDAQRRLRYRGRINDRYRLGGVRPDPVQEDVQRALDEVLAGKEVTVKETPVDGCAIAPFQPTPPRADLTYAEHVAPILAQKCVACHRAGAEAPFALTSYDGVAAKAGTIAEVVRQQRMPPWFAHPHFGRFKNERRLTAEERKTIVDWVRAGRNPGDLSKAPPVPQVPTDRWTIGEPDLIVTAEKEEVIPATGFIPYRYVAMPFKFEHDTWVQAVEIMPANPRVVHHANLCINGIGKGDGITDFITGRVPGGLPMTLTHGVAQLIPKNSILFFQLHYVTTGKEERDRISVGLRFAREPVRKRLRHKMIEDKAFVIPPHAAAHASTGKFQLECDATGLEILCHMHLRGKDSTLRAHYSDGTSKTWLVVPNYSFNWQLTFIWADGSMKLPKGTVLEFASHFDNSRFNPYNPDPSKEVRWGEQTVEEMMAGLFFYTDDSEELNLTVDPKTGRAVP